MSVVPAAINLAFSTDVLNAIEERLAHLRDEALAADPSRLRTDAATPYDDLFQLAEAVVEYVVTADPRKLRSLSIVTIEPNPVESCMLSSKYFGIIFVKNENGVYVAEELSDTKGLPT